MSIIHVKHGRQTKPLHNGISGLNGSESTGHLRFVLVYFIFINRIHVINRGDVGIIRTIFIINRYGRIQCRFQRIHRIAVIRASRQRFLFRQRKQSVHPHIKLLKFIVKVQMSAIPFKSRIVSHIFLFRIIHTSCKSGILASSPQREIVILLLCLTEKRIIPIRITICRLRSVNIDLTVCISGCFFHRRTTVHHTVSQTFPYQLPAFVSTHCRAKLVCQIRNTETGFYIISSFTLFAFLGSNQNNAIGSSRPIQGRRCGIFQYRDIFYVRRVQCIKNTQSTCVHVIGTHISRLYRDTIQYIQRLVGTGNRTNTTDADGGVRAWSPTRTAHTDSRQIGFHHLRNRNDRQIPLLFCRQDRSGSCIGRFTHITVTRYNHFL